MLPYYKLAAFHSVYDEKKLDPKQVFKPILYILFEHRRKADTHLYKHGILWNGFYLAKWKTWQLLSVIKIFNKQ